MELGPTRIKPGMWGHGALEGYPISGEVSSPFGPRVPFLTPQGMTGDFHSGLDIVAPRGTPIFAPCDFTVTFSGVPLNENANSVSGNGIYGELSDGSGIGFWHMEGLQLDLGHKVRRGDIIGQVGSSGMSTGPHLHFMRLTGPMLQDQMWFPRSQFTDPMLDFVEFIQADTIVVEPVTIDEAKFVADFVLSSLEALRLNPPDDWGYALRVLSERVEYLKELIK